MHEASLCDALFDQVDDQAAKLRIRHPDAIVSEVIVRLGERSGVEPELFRIAFDVLRLDRDHGEASLTLALTPARWRCPDCNGPTHETPSPCETCGAGMVLTTGDELVLERVVFVLAHTPESDHV